MSKGPHIEIMHTLYQCLWDAKWFMSLTHVSRLAHAVEHTVKHTVKHREQAATAIDGNCWTPLGSSVLPQGKADSTTCHD